MNKILQQEVNKYIVDKKLDKGSGVTLEGKIKEVKEDENISDQFKEAIIEELIYQAKSLIGKIFHFIGGLFR